MLQSSGLNIIHSRSLSMSMYILVIEFLLLGPRLITGEPSAVSLSSVSVT